MNSTFFSFNFLHIISYILLFIHFGMFPANITLSSLFILSIFSINSFMFSSVISGPFPFSAVSSFELIFTFILVIPFFTFIKSVFIPFSSIFFFNSSPVNPAIKPSAVLSIPKLLRTVETFKPFPPESISSVFVLFIFPTSKLSTCDM